MTETEAMGDIAAAITRLAVAVEKLIEKLSEKGSSTPQQQQREFTAREAPPMPDGACPEHGSEWRLVPAGISQKTGNRYNAFWACSTRGCNIKPGQVVEQLPF